MNNRDEKEWIKSVYTAKKFPFIYNGIVNKNPNSTHNIDNF